MEIKKGKLIRRVDAQGFGFIKPENGIRLVRLRQTLFDAALPWSLTESPHTTLPYYQALLAQYQYALLAN